MCYCLLLVISFYLIFIFMFYPEYYCCLEFGFIFIFLDSKAYREKAFTGVCWGRKVGKCLSYGESD